MTKWEYRAVQFHDAIPTIPTFNDWGENGWELVCVSDKVAFFKRPKPFEYKIRVGEEYVDAEIRAITGKN